MKDYKDEIKKCFAAFDTVDKHKQLSAQLHTWLEKAEEEMQYGDVNDAITIVLIILEKLTSRENIQSIFIECYNKALDITSIILKTPSIRSDVKLLLEYHLKQIQNISKE